MEAQSSSQKGKINNDTKFSGIICTDASKEMDDCDSDSDLVVDLQSSDFKRYVFV